MGPLEVNGSVLSEDREMVEELSKQFKSVFTVENINSLPAANPQVVSKNELKDVGIIDSESVSKHISRIKPNKAAGPDDIFAKVLRETCSELAIPLTIIFRRSMMHTEIPLDWKRANVVPIFKKGNKGKVENYRPVSLTSLVCKVLESIVKEKMVRFLDDNN